MTSMDTQTANKSLRALARDYSNGVLDNQAYRKARDELLQGVISGQIPVAANDFRAPIKTDLNSTMENMAASEITAISLPPAQKQTPATGQSAPPQPRTRPKPKPETSHDPLQIWIFAGIAIVAVCLVLVIVIYKPRTSDGTEPTVDSANVEESLDPRYTAGQNLIENFLRQNSWTDESLQQFMAQWNALNLNEQMDGLASPQKTQLANAIHRQLIEERALLGLDDAEKVIARQQLLVNFAIRLGINDPRLKVEEINAPAPVAPVTPSSQEAMPPDSG